MKNYTVTRHDDLWQIVEDSTGDWWTINDNLDNVVDAKGRGLKTRGAKAQALIELVKNHMVRSGLPPEMKFPAD